MIAIGQELEPAVVEMLQHWAVAERVPAAAARALHLQGQRVQDRQFDVLANLTRAADRREVAHCLLTVHCGGGPAETGRSVIQYFNSCTKILYTTYVLVTTVVCTSTVQRL